jgi:hypothetical protein
MNLVRSPYFRIRHSKFQERNIGAKQSVHEAEKPSTITPYWQ